VDSKPFGSPVSVDSLYEEASSRWTTSTEDSPAKETKSPTKKSAPSLDYLYNDL
jgi:hypothetical protein